MNKTRKDNSDTAITKKITDRAAGAISRVEELAYEIKVEEVMRRDVKTVSPEMRLLDVLDFFREIRISGAPVVSDNKLIGIISIEDLIRSLRTGDMEAPVSRYSSAEVITVKSYDPVVEALKIFRRTSVGRLPVLDESGKLVGILTKANITSGILKTLESDYQAEEMRRYRASHLFEDIVSDRTGLVLRYNIKPRDFINGGAASSYIKRALARLGENPQIARRCAIAIYEAEMNLIIHTTNGGTIMVEIEPHVISIITTDDGPGIQDIEQAKQAGFSTATEEVREMGFGAGMGLKNIERCVDEISLESTVGKGTRLELKINLQAKDSFRENRPGDGN
ncbi:MAG: CBS domain-containing protein [Spirochaetes bacterium]|nr:CBS domain-containing protein [Spirochaetota bacterium]